jgi:hypothetical protein
MTPLKSNLSSTFHQSALEHEGRQSSDSHCSMCRPICASASKPLSSFSRSALVLPAVFRAEKLVCRDMILEDCIICVARAVRENETPGFVEDASPVLMLGF